MVAHAARLLVKGIRLGSMPAMSKDNCLKHMESLGLKRLKTESSGAAFVMITCDCGMSNGQENVNSQFVTNASCIPTACLVDGLSEVVSFARLR